MAKGYTKNDVATSNVNDTVYVIVEKGDTLWAIAEKYLGAGNKYPQLAALNNIKNPDLIYIGQKVYIKEDSANDKHKEARSSMATIRDFGLQADIDNVLFVTWDWPRSSATEHYEVRWDYYTANKIWFVGNESTTEHLFSTYNIPSNAKQVRVKIKPIAKTYKKNNRDTKYFTALWTGWKKHTVTTPPATPSVPTVTLDGLKLTAEVINLTDDPKQIQFEIVKDNATIHKTIKVDVQTAMASCSAPILSGSVYKVRCRAYKDNVWGDWSAYSANVETIPATPTKFTKCEPKTETSIYLEWPSISNAKSYEIEYATQKSYFDGSDKVTSKTGITTTSYELSSGIETGQEYFFRVRAVNDKGNSGWSEIASTTIGGLPAAPTTWSSTTTVITGEPLNLYWVHNAKDGSSETFAEVEIIINGVTETYTVEKSTKEDEKDKTSTYSVKMVNDDGTPRYADGAKISWRVRTAGITKIYGDWSIERAVDVYAPPTLELSMTDLQDESIETLNSYPFKVTALAGPNTQCPIGYHISIVSNDIYETVDNVGNIKTVNEGEEIYSKYFDITDKLSVTISAGDLSLENGMSYTLKCSVSMDSGLSAESSIEFDVEWADIGYEPNAEISIDEDSYSAYIRPYCKNYRTVYYKVTRSISIYTLTNEVLTGVFGSILPDVTTTTGEQVYTGTSSDGTTVYYAMIEETDTIDDVLLSVYRREFDGTFTELATGIDGAKNTTITDPHPALDYARYRIVAMSKTTGSISYSDIPGYPVGGKAIIIQWDEAWSNYDVTDNEDALEQPAWSGSLLTLPYNVDVSDKHSPDVSLVEYIGRKHPVSYYGTHRGETSTWNVVIPADDKGTLYALRRLATWMGDVYVREPSGSGYWANITISFNQKHKDLTIPISLEIARVEGGI